MHPFAKNAPFVCTRARCTEIMPWLLLIELLGSVFWDIFVSVGGGHGGCRGGPTVQSPTEVRREAAVPRTLTSCFAFLSTVCAQSVDIGGTGGVPVTQAFESRPRFNVIKFRV